MLTNDFLENRAKHNRYKAFAYAGIILFVIAGSAAGGYFLYQKYQKPGDSASASAQANSGKLPHEWLVKYFGTDDENNARVGGPDGDPDEDILTNEQEFFFGTDPIDPDSDADGQYDGAEVAFNSNPLGEGELYSTDAVKKLVSQYLESQDLQEFKKENIEQQVLGILNPPDPANVQIVLPDEKTLKVIDDNSTTAVEKYLEKANAAVQDLGISEEEIVNSFDNPLASNQQLVAVVYETVNKLRNIPVPRAMAYFHQLHIAGLFASANVLEIQKTVDPNADPQQQKDKYQEQYYQVAVMQKIEQELKKEIETLRGEYPELIQKFEITNESD